MVLDTTSAWFQWAENKLHNILCSFSWRKSTFSSLSQHTNITDGYMQTFTYCTYNILLNTNITRWFACSKKFDVKFRSKQNSNGFNGMISWLKTDLRVLKFLWSHIVNCTQLSGVISCLQCFDIGEMVEVGIV